MPRRREPSLELIEALIGGWFSYMFDAVIGIIGALIRLGFGLVVFTVVLVAHLLTPQAQPSAQMVDRRTRSRNHRQNTSTAWPLVPVGTLPKSERRRS